MRKYKSATSLIIKYKQQKTLYDYIFAASYI